MATSTYRLLDSNLEPFTEYMSLTKLRSEVEGRLDNFDETLAIGFDGPKISHEGIMAAFAKLDAGLSEPRLNAAVALIFTGRHPNNTTNCQTWWIRREDT